MQQVASGYEMERGGARMWDMVRASLDQAKWEAEPWSEKVQEVANFCDPELEDCDTTTTIYNGRNQTQIRGRRRA